MLEDLINYAVEKNATDLHISSDNCVWVRTGGQITKNEFAQDMLDKFWEELDEKFLKGLHEKDFSCATSDGTRLRCNYFLANGEKTIAIRILPKSVPCITELSLPPIFSEIATADHGLVLICGDVGSGKSTSMAAMIEEINKLKSCHIVTIEDPIEYVFVSKKSLIHQREIGQDTESFAAATVSTLRQDADVVMIGEIRDESTAEAALVAAESGRLVFATLHSSSVTGVPERFSELFSNKQGARNRLARIFEAIIFQKMLYDENKNTHVATELLLHTKATENCIIDDKESALRDALLSGNNLGMFTLEQDIARLTAKFGRLTGKV